MERLDELQERLGIHFSRVELLRQALTHSSIIAESEGALSNERLEFLGDAVLDLVIAEALFVRHTDWSEGELTKAKAAVVGERSLEKVARGWDLGAYVHISRGEDLSGGRARRALLADAVEAIIGAYYLDRGLEACREFVLNSLAFVLQALERKEHERDSKTDLQEVLQARHRKAPTYIMVQADGPDHDPTFTVEVVFDDRVLGAGEGKSKKEAEQRAAAQALRTVLSEDAPSSSEPSSPCG